jgi:NAD(P)H-dependent FMN reductase
MLPPWHSPVFLASLGSMNTLERPTILLIMGSVRAGRRCPQIAAWVLSLADRSGHFACEIVDLNEWHLPFGDEPGIPAKGAYTSADTRAWSAKVASADGFIIVSPQYNWGYPAALKNALDRLYQEWSGKPLVIVTYGGHGGGKCAEQLRQVAEGLKMRPVNTMPAIAVARELIEHDAPQSAEDLKPFEAAVQQALAEMNALFVAAR